MINLYIFYHIQSWYAGFKTINHDETCIQLKNKDKNFTFKMLQKFLFKTNYIDFYKDSKINEILIFGIKAIILLGLSEGIVIIQFFHLFFIKHNVSNSNSSFFDFLLDFFFVSNMLVLSKFYKSFQIIIKNIVFTIYL